MMTSAARENVIAVEPGGAVLTCRFCGAPLRDSFADLGSSPLANSYVTAEELHRGERFYPLHAYVCAECSSSSFPRS